MNYGGNHIVSGRKPATTTRLSERIGALPYLGAFWDHGPIWAAIAMIGLDFGVVCALMLAEGLPPWERYHYRTFVWNDTIFLPAYLALVTLALGQGSPSRRFHARAWWHATVLALAFILSFGIEALSLRSGQYTVGQQLSPSKLWHTFIFGIVGYWIASSAIPVLTTAKPRWLTLAMVIALMGASYNAYRDFTSRPYPANAHLEGTYVPWHWAPRGLK